MRFHIRIIAAGTFRIQLIKNPISTDKKPARISRADLKLCYTTCSYTTCS